jgi:hypothetical protein
VPNRVEEAANAARIQQPVHALACDRRMQSSAKGWLRPRQKSQGPPNALSESTARDKGGNGQAVAERLQFQGTPKTPGSVDQLRTGGSLFYNTAIGLVSDS